MATFDTKVQYLKYRVLKAVAKYAWEGTLLEHELDIPQSIVPGKTPTMRCCVYKERAILAERVKIAKGGDRSRANVIQVIDIACDECPMGGYEVTNSCRGCLAHRCESVCKFGAISFDHNHTAKIDKSKCKECGACSRVCPYSAIRNFQRPCQQACKVKAISMGEEGEACIDDSKCISCGACVYQCPFGAITDKSYILDVIDILKNKKQDKYKTYAVVAPAISSQFTYAKLEQVVSGLKVLGFDSVVEAALGADMVALAESKELAKNGFLTSSCCPAFVSFVEKNYPDMKQYISTNLSPMATIAKFIKEKAQGSCKVVFIGPCTAKKMEVKKPNVSPYVDAVITFEELQALFDSREIDLTTLPLSNLDGASYFGRIFARCSGLSNAVEEALKEQGMTDFELKPCSCNGIEECKLALLKKSKGLSDVNFIEGMACFGGCIGGAGCLTHGERNKTDVEKYGLQAGKSIEDAVESAADGVLTDTCS